MVDVFNCHNIVTVVWKKTNICQITLVTDYWETYMGSFHILEIFHATLCANTEGWPSWISEWYSPPVLYKLSLVVAAEWQTVLDTQWDNTVWQTSPGKDAPQFSVETFSLLTRRWDWVSHSHISSPCRSKVTLQCEMIQFLMRIIAG